MASNPAAKPGPSPPDFQKTPIQPVECLKAGKEMIAEQYWLFTGICVLGMMIGSAVPLGILMGPMLCGIYLCYLQRLRGERVLFETLFKGFDHFAESMIATLIMTGLSLVVLLPMYCLLFAGMAVAGGGDKDAAGVVIAVVFAVFYLVVIAITLLMGVFFMFTYLLIVDHGLKAMDALKTSYRAGKANFGGLLGLVLLNMLLSMVGMCVCCVGAYLVTPICFGAVVQAYLKVFPDPAALKTPPAKPAPPSFEA